MTKNSQRFPPSKSPESSKVSRAISPREYLSKFNLNSSFSGFHYSLVHERIEEGADFSFNYNVLLLVSGVIAGLGLVSNNSTSIIASMLVSPLMGPVVGLAYGTTIRDAKLVKKSLRNEIISLVVCILIGAVIAACTGPTALSNGWPTQEMASRASKENFLIALPIAFFSGLGVAVSLLDDQTASLVGVAISASLLPPAVNSGCLWVAYAFYEGGLITPSDYGYDDDTGIQLSKESYQQAGVTSLAVTLTNIILIWISSMLMFRMKEVLPIKKRVFWDDLRVARQIYTHRAWLQSHTASSVANNLSPTSDENRLEEDVSTMTAPKSEISK